MYRPRGGMNRLLVLVAERAGFDYQPVGEGSLEEEEREAEVGRQESES